MTETLERSEELERIAAALDEAAGGTGRLVVIEGPPGIGKTRLVGDARELAKDKNFGRLMAVGDEPERTLPWGVVRQLVERSVARYHGRTRRHLLEGPAGEALAALDRALENPSGDEASQARTLHALWWVAADLAAERPLLISVDDAQWADTPSLRFLAYLARRLADLPIALVVGTRPPEDAEGPLVDLTDGRGGQRILPQPLSREAIARLVQRGDAAPAPEVVEALHLASGGNPFLTGQIVDELEALGEPVEHARTASVVRNLGPRTVSRALLTRLPPDAVALARAAAVLGARADAALAAELARLDWPLAAVAVDALVKGGVLRDEPGQLAFVHPVIRGAVLRELPATDRAELHAEAARRLHAAGALPGRVAGHLAAAPAGTLPDAADLLRAAAEEAHAEGDPATAADLFERALDEHPGDLAVLGLLGLALLDAGRHAEARERLRTAARGTEDPVEQAHLHAAAAFATHAVDGPEAAVRELRADLEAFREDPDSTPALILEERLALSSSFAPADYQRSGERLQRFADLPGATPYERAILAMVAQRAFSDCRPASEVREVAGRALGNGALLADSRLSHIGWGIALHATIFADGIDEARREYALARDAMPTAGSPIAFGMTAVVGAYIALRTGHVAECEAEAAATIAALVPGDGPAQDAIRAVAMRALVLAMLERGDRAGATAAMTEFDASVEGAERTVPLTRLGHARAALALANDDPSLARTEAESLGAFEAEAGIDNPSIPWRSIAAQGALRLGDEEEARRLVAEQLDLARRWGVPGDIGAALRVQARVGPAADRVATLEEAVAVLEPSFWRLELAGALCDLGETLRVARRRRDATEPLTRAAEMTSELGALALRTRAYDALASLGTAPRKLMFSGLESLTASERRVAELAAGGHSNREIAQELFITPKTVENHLGRVYNKLGLGGRRELSGALSAS